MSFIATGLLIFTTITALVVNTTTKTPQRQQTSHEKARALRLRIRLARSSTELDKLEREARRLANTSTGFTAWTRCLNAEIKSKRSQLKIDKNANRDQD